MAESFVITRKTNPSRVSVDANIETRFMMAELIRALRELEFALPDGEAPVTSYPRLGYDAALPRANNGDREDRRHREHHIDGAVQQCHEFQRRGRDETWG